MGKQLFLSESLQITKSISVGYHEEENEEAAKKNRHRQHAIPFVEVNVFVEILFENWF